MVYENISKCCYYCGDPEHRYDSCTLRARPPEGFYLIRNELTEGDEHHQNQPDLVILGSDTDEGGKHNNPQKHNQGRGRGRRTKGPAGTR